MKACLILGLLVAVGLCHFLVPIRPAAAFVLGGALVVAGFCLMGGGRAYAAFGFVVLLAGLAIASIGVAVRVTRVTVPPNPAARDSALYYQGWLRIEEQRLGAQRGQRVRLFFEPGGGNMLRVETNGLAPEARRAIAAKIEKSFMQNYPAAPLRIVLDP